METALLNGLGRFSIGLALLAMLGVIVDPLLLPEAKNVFTRLRVRNSSQQMAKT